jgi:uncharacterized membrane protein
MDKYLLLKTLHIVGVVLFLGNIVVTGWWKAMADRTGNPVVIAFAQRQVTLTDWVLTAAGALLVAGTGLGNAALHDMDYLHIRWLSWGYGLFVLSGVIWVMVLIPIQIAQARLAHAFAAGGAIPGRYWTLNRLWYVFGVTATLIPFANIYWMVYKPV